MAKKMLIDATHAEETRVVVVDGNKVDEFDFESVNKRQLAGNIYLAKVTRVEPSLQAAFVDYGGNRHGFLAFSEIHPDYYQIPVADREALLAEERAYAESLHEEEPPVKEKPKRSRSRRKSSRSKADAASNAAETPVTEGAEPQETATPAEAAVEQHPAPEAPAQDAPVADPAPDSPLRQDDAAPQTDDAPEAADTGDGEEGTKATPSQVEDDSDKGTPPTTMAAAARSDDPVETREPSGDIPGMDVVEPEGDIAPEGTIPEEDAAPEAHDHEDDAEPQAKGSDATERDDQIESVADEDVTEEIRPRKPRPRRYKIQEVIKVRQIMLVQVVKEERGNKGAALTTYLSLAGRYCVLMPNTARGGGISRKITNATDRKKLKEIAADLSVPEGAGLIIRTAGAQRTKSEIKRDYEYLMRLWEQIRELTLKSIAPAPIYEEGNLIKRAIRDLYNREIDEVLVEGEAGYRVAKDFMKMIMPSHAKNVKHYNEAMPLFARYQVESYLSSMFNPTVQLKSGGYIVIGVTEALVAIDVNSGKATKEGSIEETALKTNLEAAEEVARQLRLRDLAGLIVIDFIDMEERKNNTAVEKRLKDKLKNDRARIQVGRISGFGLLEMSRQRLRPGMIEASTQPCPHCHGTGLIRSDDSLALSILRQIEEEGVRGRSKEVLVKAPVGIVNYLMNQKREHVAQIELRYGVSVRIEADAFMIPPDFTIERLKTATRAVPEVNAPVISVDSSELPEPAQAPQEAAPEESTAEKPAEDKPKKRRRRSRKKKKPSQTGEGGNGQGQDAQARAGDGQGEATTPDQGADAQPDAATDQPQHQEVPQQPAPEQAPVASEDAPQPQEDAPVAASTHAPDAQTAAEAPQPEADTDAPQPQAEVSHQPAPEPAPEPVVPTQTTWQPAPDPSPSQGTSESDEDDKPKKRGWWSLGR
ncbi:ribonuclease E/G [Rhodovulum adriaticum]|uniref:Ribonuclease E n=1 Tax=Rhodovulum adriaticum TaxID=35804 RepID=A0A4R2NUQ6_RHOAD|nr:ribonuclease E/G [Rhodovulum adriaticum]MBK1635097.1 ribonuclease [Rhodovulum adriaticum]TCP25268.1 RNAse E [Rhodovulum adriaticum]